MSRAVAFVVFYFVAALAHGHVDENIRLDCYPDPGASQELCERRGCVWEPVDDSAAKGTPYCFFPEGTGYSFDGARDPSYIPLLKTVGSPKNPFDKDFEALSFTQSYIGSTLNVKLFPSTASPKNPFDKDFETLTFTQSYIGSTLNVKLFPSTTRYEPPVDLPRQPSHSSDKLSVVLPSRPGNFSFNIRRESTGTNVWDTSIGGLLFGDKFIQIATYLSSDKMYGWGENTHQTIKHDFSRYKTWGMWPRDQPPNSAEDNSMNLYARLLAIQNMGNVAERSATELSRRQFDEFHDLSRYTTWGMFSRDWGPDSKDFNTLNLYS
uniref:P-type domain-containing protein n=1 Tax=Steinernema glaseri TaxID=37863 RepID=A0A1I7YBY2_9BILA